MFRFFHLAEQHIGLDGFGYKEGFLHSIPHYIFAAFVIQQEVILRIQNTNDIVRRTLSNEVDRLDYSNFLSYSSAAISTTKQEPALCTRAPVVGFSTPRTDRVTARKLMDRRQKKTRDAIFRAFGSLLEKKRFENITVQEIIDEANIGRSTFYAHFETKDELLRSMCTDIFHHVFTEELPQEADHDYSAGSKSLELKLGHVLYHLRENRLNLKGLLASESGELFLSFLKDYLGELFARYLDEFHLDIPEDFLLHHLTGSFAETVKWWVAKDMAPDPETVAGYYAAVIKK